MTDLETFLAVAKEKFPERDARDLELLRHDYETVMKSPELKARLDCAIAWVLKATDAKEREERIKTIQAHASKRLAQIREGN